jgi:hypothetical protein
MAYSTAGVLLQQAAHHQQHQPTPQQDQQQQQQQQQHWATTPVHALASALLYILLSMVTLMLSTHRSMHAAASRAAAFNSTCQLYISQRMQLVSGAAARAAAAEEVEDLWQLLQHPHTSSSSSSNNDSTCSSDSKPNPTAAVQAIYQLAADTSATVTADTADCRWQLKQQRQQQQQQQLAQPSGCCSSLLVVAGLWVGVVWWAGRWLLLQAPAATGAAVTSTCQQGVSAAEEAAVLAVEYMVRVIYGFTWAVAKQLRSVMACAAQVVLVHGTAAAQQACCLILWVVGFANGDSQQQRSQLQQLLVQVLQLAGAAVGRCGQWGMASAEVVAAAVAVKLLRDASPVTQVRIASCSA